MKKIIITLLWLCGSAYGACTVIDDAGRTITVKNTAKRIVSLSPDLTEDLFAIGAGAKIVGVIHGSDYPDTAKKIKNVASYNSVDVEGLLLTHPDLIVTWAEGVNVSQLEKWGIPIYVSHPKKLTDIPVTLRKLGCLVGESLKADEEAKNFIIRYHELAKKFSKETPVNVFYQVWSTPVITVSKGSWIHEAIIFCGGKNIFANLKGAAPEVTVESVLLENPEIIVGGMKEELWKNKWLSWPQMKAVKNQQLISIHSDLIERPGPRLIDGIRELCVAINNSRMNRGNNVTD